MSNRDFDTIYEMTENRFPGTSFRVSCFDSVEEIQNKVVTYFHDTIIIAYHYRMKYYQNLNIKLQDMDYVVVHKQEGKPYIYYCDVIDALIESEKAGDIKPNYHLFMEGIVCADRLFFNQPPVYKIAWGS